MAREENVTMAVMPKRYRFTVDDYDRLAEIGVPECERVELLDGDFVEMTPIGDRHASVVARLVSLFSHRLGERAIVWPQNPIQLRAVRSVPQPDIVLLRPREDFYARPRPGSDDVLLLIEVMDTSARIDRRVKLPLYARAGITETWLIDLTTDRIDAFRRPTATGYSETSVFSRGQDLAPAALPDLRVTVDDLIG
jgi:Uma2 family endonuclease